MQKELKHCNEINDYIENKMFSDQNIRSSIPNAVATIRRNGDFIETFVTAEDISDKRQNYSLHPPLYSCCIWDFRFV